MVKSRRFTVVVAVILVVAGVIAYPHVHAWLTDDAKVIRPGGLLATDYRALPKRPGDRMLGEVKVFDKWSIAGATANFSSTSSDSDIFDYYSDMLRSRGWEMLPRNPSRREIRFCKGGISAIVQIEDNGQKIYYFGIVSQSQKQAWDYCPLPAERANVSADQG
jgi:hypothetical protein